VLSLTWIFFIFIQLITDIDNHIRKWRFRLPREFARKVRVFSKFAAMKMRESRNGVEMFFPALLCIPRIRKALNAANQNSPTVHGPDGKIVVSRRITIRR
jgi:hypothetical protein